MIFYLTLEIVAALGLMRFGDVHPLLSVAMVAALIVFSGLASWKYENLKNRVRDLESVVGLWQN